MEDNIEEISNNAAKSNDTEQINMFDLAEDENSEESSSLQASETDFSLSNNTLETANSSTDINVTDKAEDTIDSEQNEENEVLDGQIEIDIIDKDPEDTELSVSSSPGRRKNEYNPENPRKIDTLFDFVELFIFALVAVLVFTTFFFRHSVVEGSSMESTLHDGEHLIISSFLYQPERGDIVVCEDYSTPHKKPIVKRIIAIEGDHIEVTPNGKVTLNGELLTEEYVFIDGIVTGYPVNITVGEGEIFVMGDHRNMSDDSRSFGPVDTDSIIGKVILRFYPFDKFGNVE